MGGGAKSTTGLGPCYLHTYGLAFFGLAGWQGERADGHFDFLAVGRGQDCLLAWRGRTIYWFLQYPGALEWERERERELERMAERTAERHGGRGVCVYAVVLIR